MATKKTTIKDYKNRMTAPMGIRFIDPNKKSTAKKSSKKK